MLARADRLQFMPPRQNPALVSVMQRLAPGILRSRGIMTVECREEELERLRQLAPERLALFPNHPTALDPAVVFHLSGLVGQRFHYLCARELFQWLHGAWGWTLQRMGGYSVLRGTPDREAFMMTRELLTRPGMKLVAFPEGEVYSQNDSLLPYHNGIIQLVFWAQEDLSASGCEDGIRIVPLAVRYEFIEDVREKIKASLTRLEEGLDLPARREGLAPDPDDFFARLSEIGEAVLMRLEVEYGLPPEPQGPLPPRIERLKETILNRVASSLHVRLTDATFPDRLRHLINAVYEVNDEPPTELCQYERRLREDSRQRTMPMACDIERLANWMALSDGYITPETRVERVAELVSRLEEEVLGPFPKGLPPSTKTKDGRLVGKKRCVLRVGEPIDVREHLPAYQADRRRTVAELTDHIEDVVYGMLTGTAAVG